MSPGSFWCRLAAPQQFPEEAVGSRTCTYISAARGYFQVMQLRFLPSPPPLPLALQTPFWPQSSAWGFFFFFVLPFQSSGGGGQPRARAVQAGWLGRERLPRRGALVAACRAVWGRLRNPPTVRTHQQVRNNTGYLHASCNPWIRLGNVLLHVENLLPFSKEISPTLCSDNRLASSAGCSVELGHCLVEICSFLRGHGFRLCVSGCHGRAASLHPA